MLKNRVYIKCAVLLLLLYYSCENKHYPYFIESDDHGVLWVANANDNTITCIDRLNDEEVGTFEVGIDPSRTAVDLDGNCWVGCRGDDQVFFVTQTGYIKPLNGFNSARGVALDKEGNVWVANSGNNTIQKISMPDTVVSEMLDIADTALYYYGALVDANNYLWILDRLASALIKYNTALYPDPEAYDIIKMSGTIYGFTLDRNNNVWVAGMTEPFLYKIDAVKAELIERYTIPAEYFGGMVTGVTFDINDNIWVSNYSTGMVLCFNPTTGEFSNFDTKGNTPHGLGADDSGFIYTINLGSNNISKINAETGAFVMFYEVGRGPYTYSDLTGFIYRHVTLSSEEE